MTIDGLDDDAIRAVLEARPRVALVGASNRAERPSYGVMRFLLEHGFEVVPVNPELAGQQIHGRMVVGTLEEAAPLELVDVFRAPEAVGPVVSEAVRLGARTIWMQLGVVNEAAAAVARRAGLVVVMDRCPKIEFARLQMV